MFAVIPLACIAHILWALFFGAQRQWPVVEMVLLAAAVITLLRMLVASRPLRVRLLLLNITGWACVAGFLWWTQVYSSYPKMNVKVSVGESVTVRLSHSEKTSNPVVAPAPAEEDTRLPGPTPAPIKIQLALPQEEEIFLDASGKSFQLTPQPISRKEEIKTAVAAKGTGAKPLNAPLFLNQSDATLVVFFRGWW